VIYERRLRVAFDQWLSQAHPAGLYGEYYDLDDMLEAFAAGYHLLRLDENPRDRAMTVACPKCQVDAYERCVPHRGGLVHRARVLAWNRMKGAYSEAGGEAETAPGERPETAGE
jgi:hypothetical protein